ncbi:hypothetical protein G6F22_021119 [Rhizopus arrhizus]|nr:hypothetical protein G6F22_021119 [Rhizopus arrhizus]
MANAGKPVVEINRLKIVLETPAFGCGEVGGKLLPASLATVTDHPVHATAEQILAQLPNSGQAPAEVITFRWNELAFRA